MPNSRQARITRIAISPRFAIKTRCSTTHTLEESRNQLAKSAAYHTRPMTLLWSGVWGIGACGDRCGVNGRQIAVEQVGVAEIPGERDATDTEVIFQSQAGVLEIRNLGIGQTRGL